MWVNIFSTRERSMELLKRLLSEDRPFQQCHIVIGYCVQTIGHRPFAFVSKHAHFTDKLNLFG